MPDAQQGPHAKLERFVTHLTVGFAGSGRPAVLRRGAIPGLLSLFNKKKDHAGHNDSKPRNLQAGEAKNAVPIRERFP